jgi:hypothetical protein
VAEAAPAFGAPAFEGADGKPASREDGRRLLAALVAAGRLPDDGEILIVPGGTVLADDEDPILADVATGPSLHCAP